MAALMTANPKLKPTTAIKAMGVSDPSSIRRLRDKFHAARNELMAALPAPSSQSAYQSASGFVMSCAATAFIHNAHVAFLGSALRIPRISFEPGRPAAEPIAGQRHDMLRIKAPQTLH